MISRSMSDSRGVRWIMDLGLLFDSLSSRVVTTLREALVADRGRSTHPSSALVARAREENREREREGRERRKGRTHGMGSARVGFPAGGRSPPAAEFRLGRPLPAEAWVVQPFRAGSGRGWCGGSPRLRESGWLFFVSRTGRSRSRDGYREETCRKARGLPESQFRASMPPSGRGRGGAYRKWTKTREVVASPGERRSAKSLSSRSGSRSRSGASTPGRRRRGRASPRGSPSSGPRRAAPSSGAPGPRREGAWPRCCAPPIRP